MNKTKEKIQNVFDIIIVILLAFVGISKGGFYSLDSNFFELCFVALFLFYVVIRKIKKIKEEKKIDFISLLLLIVSLSYALPIIFKNYADFNASMDEFVRYLCIYVIYNIAKNSNNNKIYENGIITIGVILCIFGLDGMGTRFFEPLLSNFKSGYLDTNKLRMSSTIQYANTFSCFILIAYIFANKVVINNLNLLLARKKIFKFNIYYTILTIFVASIILSGSKLVWLLMLISMIFCYLLCKRKLNLTVLLLTFAEGIVYSNIITILSVNIPGLIISSVFVLYVVNYIFLAVLTSLIKKIAASKLYNNSKSKFRTIFLTAILFFSFSVIFVLNASIKFTMKYNDNVNSVDKYIYNILPNTNTLELSVLTEDNAKYFVEIWQKKQDGTEEKLKELSYSNTSTGKFLLNINLDSNAKALHLRFNIKEGAFKLEHLKLNGEERHISYAFIPYSIIEKALDLFNGSTSVTDRTNYYIDALKIITSSKSNFFLGVGGGGFEQLYKTVQTIKYSTTEVHSSFLQIFLESGIFGFVSIIVVLILSLIKAKGYNFVSLLVLAIHSFLDLNFSYFFMLVLFAILLGMSNSTKHCSLGENKIEK